MSAPPTPGQLIDDQMERASKALLGTDYFQTEMLCERALDRSLMIGDLDRAARIALPLQEARRQLRQLATDSERVVLCDTREVLEELGDTRRESASPAICCVLLAPPLLGIDGRNLHQTLRASRVPGFVITREPQTRDGLWPLVAVGRASYRVKVEPPANPAEPSLAWFESAAEALGDAAIENCTDREGTAKRVATLYDALTAMPHHEKLHQRFADACRAALNRGVTSLESAPSEEEAW
ncbi:MAG: hypothetical protein AAGG07_00675 [Planctomycetota bacterium]